MLKRNISITSGIAIAISMVIGSGIFALPGMTISATDPITALLGWLSIIFLMIPLVAIFTFLGRKFPSAGGISLYATKVFGSQSEGGFSLLICGTLAVGMPAFFMIGGAYIAELLSLNVSLWTLPCSIFLAFLSTFINYLGSNKLGLINKLAVILILFLVFTIIVLSLPSHNMQQYLAVALNNYNFDYHQLWLASSIIFWAFLGWENLSFGLEEFDNPDRNIPIIFWSSFIIIAVCYFFFALTASISAINGTTIEGLSGIATLMGSGIIRKILLIIAVFVLIANANSWVFGASRAFYSAAQQGVIFKKLQNLNLQKIPVNSLFFTFVLYSLIMVAINYYNIPTRYLFLLTNQGFIILYGAAILAFIKYNRSFKGMVIAFLASLSWLFLISGFGTLILYPVLLFIIGFILQKRAKHTVQI